ncbi:MAG: Exodeoxyribonuclease [Candidatus Saccharibacteria bacterium]|nr:Exodeoxyribonuclease [Candidatus Saccharibacteria bacterium]
MASSFFFYDLETTGVDPRNGRIMQFAGQRTDMALNPIGEPVNMLIKLSPDVLPEPDAILITGITPQQTLLEGVTEAEFLEFFMKEVVTPGTIFMGFNSVRFDDEFMRFLLYRNFYDAYEWQWKDECTRWDLLDVVRMTRALRPDGIEWPFAPDGRPTNRLEFLTKVNKLDHFAAHDALSDVHATIAVAKLIREKQKDLFDYLLKGREKKVASQLVLQGAPFIYTSGRYPSETYHTTAAILLAKNPQGDALVYDLRHDPTAFMAMSPEQIVEAWKYKKDSTDPRLPVKTLKYNRCPAVAPLGVIKDAATQERIGLTLDTVAANLDKLKGSHQEFAKKVLAAVDLMDKDRKKSQTSLVDNEFTVDTRLYDGFVGDQDKTTMRAIRTAQPQELDQLASNLKDERLQSLLPLYKARNYPAALSSDERQAWDEFCAHKLFDGGNQSRLAKYFARLQELAATRTSSKDQYLLEELQLYGQSIMPSDAG